MQNRLSLLALLASATALAATPALSQDAEAFGQRFLDIMAVSGLEMSYETATAEGDTITLADFTITPEGEDSVELPGELVFSGVAEGADGSFTAESATIADIDFAPEDAEEDVRVTAANFLIEGITLPADYAADDLSGLLLYRNVSVGPIAVSVDGNDVFSIASFVSSVDADDALTEVSSSYTMSGMMVDIARIVAAAETPEEIAQAAEAQAVIDAFGVEQLTAEFSGAGTWSPESGDAEVTDLRFDFAELGALSLSAEITGYTGELYAETMKSQQKMMALGDDVSDEDAAAMEEAMMAMFADVGIASFSMHYEDASLFTKALDFIAAEQGVDGATFAAGLQFMVPMMLTEVQNPAFTTAVTEALNAFIADPQSITIAAMPAEPVQFADFMGVEENPFALIDILGLTVSANE